PAQACWTWAQLARPRTSSKRSTGWKLAPRSVVAPTAKPSLRSSPQMKTWSLRAARQRARGPSRMTKVDSPGARTQRWPTRLAAAEVGQGAAICRMHASQVQRGAFRLRSGERARVLAEERGEARAVIDGLGKLPAAEAARLHRDQQQPAGLVGIGEEVVAQAR